ncbi:hypothetical protein IJ21_39940 [Paenibacillus sp. 32O-W]|uniref:hypothetical protein n=1 Tax=Paenibacillus sp. 32O-W TaxID=1695218 RepID=UPI000722E00C|nr:hypothetical protein [Paenibacillus sp. 32O-W]ALS29380.1 hypothetical protein IJ21_39940 [Paenibacillus sp. 32O-W]
MSSQLQAIVRTLELRTPAQPLTPINVWDEELDRRISSLTEEDLPIGRGGRETLDTVKAGLHLWNDNLFAAHELVQNIDTPTGSYWHGIMHRMEGDYPNAKYWFRQTGRHPAMIRLIREASAWLKTEAGLFDMQESEGRAGLMKLAAESEWNPYWFVDLVELLESGRADRSLRPILEHIQRLEIKALIESTIFGDPAG